MDIRLHPRRWYEASGRRYRSLTRTALALRFATFGAFAGIAACVLAYGLSLVFDVSQPGLVTVLFAMLRGAVFAVLVALILWWQWHRE